MEKAKKEKKLKEKKRRAEKGEKTFWVEHAKKVTVQSLKI
jgi:hypothetical protein